MRCIRDPTEKTGGDRTRRSPGAPTGETATAVCACFLLITLASASLGCRRDSSGARAEEIVDLTVLSPEPSLIEATRSIDFGTDAAWPHLVTGWSKDTIVSFDGEAATVALAIGDVSTLRFFVPRVIDIPLSLRVAPVARPGIAPVGVDLRVNGRAWESLTLDDGFNAIELTLPVSLLGTGWNVMEISNRPALLARKLAPGQDRRLAWDTIVFAQDCRERPLPAAPAGGDRELAIPPCSALSFQLDLPPMSLLEFKASAAAGSARGATVHLSWLDAATGEVREREVAANGRQVRWELTGGAPAVGRLDVTQTGGSTVILDQPRIVSRSASPVVRADTVANQEPVRPASPPDIIVYLVDTLRADHMGCYGYPKDTTPWADGFAREAVVFDDCQAQSPWTRSSVASMLTGLWPQAHGTNGRPDVLPDEATTLPELLRERGYETVAFVTNTNVIETFGFAQGFSEFHYLEQPSGDRRFVRSETVNTAVFDWLAGRTSDAPFLLWVHTMDPHAPYEPLEPYRGRFAVAAEGPTGVSLEDLQARSRRKELISRAEVDTWIGLYDGEIAANDAGFGALIRELRQRDVYDDAVVVFLSDHGEEFYDHYGWYHGRTLHAEILDVPLIVKPPRWRGQKRVGDLVQHADLLPTILDFVGLPAPTGIQGTSLRPLIEGTGQGEGRPRVSVAHLALGKLRATSLTTGGWKIIVAHHGESDGYPRLYDRQTDPAEQRNLGLLRAARAQSLVSILARSLLSIDYRLPPRYVGDSLDQRAQDHLRELGYAE